MSAARLDGAFALDVQGVQRLRHDAARDPEGSLRAAASQFEALMLQMMLKSMREATPRSGLMDSSQGRFLESLMDQQWAQQMSGQGFGLADQLVAQLSGQQVGLNDAAERHALLAGIPRGTPTDLRGREVLAGKHETGSDTDADGLADTQAFPMLSPDSPTSAVAEPRDLPSPGMTEGPEGFVAGLSQAAFAAARETGIPAELMLAQAALETGWGRYRISTAEGGDSYNLFGIKAGGDWQGATTTVATHEYIEGRRVRVSGEFRVYDSYQDAFADYGRLVGDNPRYAAVAAATSAEQAARELQAAGYATDPAYADKLIALIQRSRAMVHSG